MTGEIYTKERAAAASAISRASASLGTTIRKLDRRAYRRYRRKRDPSAPSPQDISVLFGTWERALDLAEEYEREGTSVLRRVA